MEGILTHAELESLVREGAVAGSPPVEPDQIQPNSLDLRLGARALRIRAGFLPMGESVERRARELELYEIDLASGAVLEPGNIHLVELAETLRLPSDTRARFNPKSSTGRLDVFTRVAADGAERFDEAPDGYQGPLWIEIVPRSFPIRVRAGSRLVQVRFLRGSPRLGDEELREAQRAHSLLLDPAGRPLPPRDLRLEGGCFLSVSLRPAGEDEASPVGWRARRYTGVVDVDAVASLDPLEYFEPIRAPGGRLILEPEEFYIFRSRERIRVPPHLAAEMTAYHPSLGELRTHYAGFFDSGFGYRRAGDRSGAPAVLEVRPHDVPFVLEDGQLLFRLEFARTTRPCERLYGSSGSHYAAQELTLAKQFRSPS